MNIFFTIQQSLNTFSSVVDCNALTRKMLSVVEALLEKKFWCEGKWNGSVSVTLHRSNVRLARTCCCEVMFYEYRTSVLRCATIGTGFCMKIIILFFFPVFCISSLDESNNANEFLPRPCKPFYCRTNSFYDQREVTRKWLVYFHFTMT